MDEREIELMQTRIRYLEGMVLSLIGHLENQVDGAAGIGWEVAESVSERSTGQGEAMTAWDRYFRAVRTSVDSDGPMNVSEVMEKSDREKAALRNVFGERLGHI